MINDPVSETVEFINSVQDTRGRDLTPEKIEEISEKVQELGEALAGQYRQDPSLIDSYKLGGLDTKSTVGVLCSTLTELSKNLNRAKIALVAKEHIERARELSKNLSENDDQNVFKTLMQDRLQKGENE